MGLNRSPQRGNVRQSQQQQQAPQQQHQKRIQRLENEPSALVVPSRTTLPAPSWAQSPITATPPAPSRVETQDFTENSAAKKAVIQTGIDRYILVKRKRSPQKNSEQNQSKIVKTTREKDSMSNNRFQMLSDADDQVRV